MRLAAGLTFIAVILAPGVTAPGSSAADDPPVWRLVGASIEVLPGTTIADAAPLYDHYQITLRVRNDGGVGGWGVSHLTSYWVVYDLGHGLQSQTPTIGPGETRDIVYIFDTGSDLDGIWIPPGPAWLCANAYTPAGGDDGHCWSVWVGTGGVPAAYPTDLEHWQGLPYPTG